VEQKDVLVVVMVIHLNVQIAVKFAINVQKMVATVDVFLVMYAVVVQNVEKMDVNVVVMEIHQNVYVV